MVRLRSRINHVNERKHDSESCYAGYKGDFGEMIQVIMGDTELFKESGLFNLQGGAMCRTNQPDTNEVNTRSTILKNLL